MHTSSFTYQSVNGWSQPLELQDSENTLVVVFGASKFYDNTAVIEELINKFPNSQIIGCSTAGEIFYDEVKDQSLSVAVLNFEKTQLKSAIAKVDDPEKSFAAGQSLVSDLFAKDLKAIFVLSEGLNVNGSELVKGLKSKLNADVTITGGLAGDGSDFKRTWILDKSGISSNKIVAVGFYGDHIEVGYGSKGGWDIFGPERSITKSEGNIVYEIDGKPALSLYKSYLGDRAKGLPATGLLFPLAIRENENDKNPLVRTILSVDEKTQSMTFAGDVPKNYKAQLMHANFDRLIDGAGDASLMANETQDPNMPILSIAISCVGRRLVLGERSEEEVGAALDILSTKDAQQIGFYSYGELCPTGQFDCELHNQTMTITTFRENL